MKGQKFEKMHAY